MNRRMAVVLLMAAVAAGCKKGAPTPEAAEAKDDVKGVTEAYMAAWNAHDAAKAASYFADSVTYYDASVGVPVIGRDSAQAKVIQVFLTAVPDCSWTMEGPMVVGDHGMAFQWVFKGTNTGPWSDGTKATGKPFELRGLTMIRVRNGKILYQGDYYDALGFYKQLGMM